MAARGCVGQWYTFCLPKKQTVWFRYIHLTLIMWPGQSDRVFPQLFKMWFPPYDMTSCKGTLSQRDIRLGPPRSVNTIPVYPVSTFAFASQPSPFVSTYRRKGKDRHPWQKLWNGSSDCGMWPRRKRVWVFAFSRHSRGWSETRYLPHETAAARSTWQSSQNFGFTEVSLTHHPLLCVCARW